MDVVVWLRSLGLGKYEAAFRENDIDETVLPGLTDETLKELGVASIGHRVKLLDAIAALRNEGSGKAPTVDAATTSTSPNAHPEDRAVRRQVTVMFSDLVGSTALSARMDPEDLLRTNEISDKTHVGSSGGIQSASNARPNAADEVLPTLPLAPTLAPGIAIKEEADANATPGTYLDDGGKEIVKALEALPIGSPIAFASKDLGALLLADAPIVRGTEAYRQVEHLAQACNCSVSLQEKTNTITFYRNETTIKHEANENSELKARGGVGAWGFAYKGSIFVEDRRFLIKLFAIQAVILMVTYIVLASIQSEEAPQPEQYLGRSGNSQIKAAPTTASGIGGASSSGAQSQGEERLALAAEKRRQEEAAAKKEAERLALEAEKKRQEEVAKKEAERLPLEAEKERQEEAARKDAERLALEAEKERQEEAARKDAERLALEAEKERREEAARKDAERLALEAEKERQEERPAGAEERGRPSGIRGGKEAGFCGSADICTFPCGADLSAQRQGRRRSHNGPTAGADGNKGGSRQGRSRGSSRPMPGIGYYFRSDHEAAVDVSHRVQPLLGPVEPALLELRGKVPPPGTVEIAVPGRGAR